MSTALIPATDRSGDGYWHLHDECRLPIQIANVKPGFCPNCMCGAVGPEAWLPLYLKEVDRG